MPYATKGSTTIDRRRRAADVTWCGLLKKVSALGQICREVAERAASRTGLLTENSADLSRTQFSQQAGSGVTECWSKYLLVGSPRSGVLSVVLSRLNHAWPRSGYLVASKAVITSTGNRYAAQMISP